MAPYKSHKTSAATIGIIIVLLIAVGAIHVWRHTGERAFWTNTRYPKGFSVDLFRSLKEGDSFDDFEDKLPDPFARSFFPSITFYRYYMEPGNCPIGPINKNQNLMFTIGEKGTVKNELCRGYTVKEIKELFGDPTSEEVIVARHVYQYSEPKNKNKPFVFFQLHIGLDNKILLSSEPYSEPINP